MTGIGVSISDGSEAGLWDEVERRIEGGMGRALEALEASASEAVPIGTGALRDSIAAERTGPLAGRVVFGAEYAPYLHFGTGLYGPLGREIVIVPLAKRALYWPGASHPVRRASVKGIRPMDFVRRAIEASDTGAEFEAGFASGGEGR